MEPPVSTLFLDCFSCVFAQIYCVLGPPSCEEDFQPTPDDPKVRITKVEAPNFLEYLSIRM
ncbi:MAG: hypothetical protein ACK55I_33285, partial [bacterium]